MKADDFLKQVSENNVEGLNLCVVTDSPALQTGLHSLLSRVESVEAVYDLDSLTEFDPYTLSIDILVLVPGFGSNSDLREILENSPDIGVLVLGADDLDQSRIVSAISDYTWGFLPLDATGKQIEAAIHAIAAGLSVGVPALLKIPLWDTTLCPDEEIIDPLTARELEVLQLLAQGMANKQIALRLKISEHTVKFHVSSIYTKLGAANRTEAVRLGVRRGLILL
jgi:NarL family two-component system response regulator YdfI